MSKHFRTYVDCISAWLMTAASHATGSVRYGWEARRYRDDRVPLEVLLTNGSRRRKIERELRAGLRQLQHVLGRPSLVEIAIVVQQVITMDRQLAGCYQLRQRPDGSQSALLRVALEVNHTRLSSDELLAVVAEQWIAITNLQDGPSLLVQIEYESKQTSPEKRAPSLRPDPLMPYRGGGVHPHRP